MTVTVDVKVFFQCFRMVFVSPSCENVDPEDDEVLSELDEGSILRPLKPFAGPLQPVTCI